MEYRKYIEDLKMEWIGKKVMYDGRIYTIVTVDYNGMLHINKPSKHNATTAVFTPGTAMEALVCCECCKHCDGSGWCGHAGEAISFHTPHCEDFEER